MIQSTYRPVTVAEFDSSKVTFIGTGVSGVALPGTGSNIDLLVPNDCLLSGVQLNCQNQLFGDTVGFQVLDTLGTAKIYNAPMQAWISVPAGTLLNQFVTNWTLNSDTERQVDQELPYPAKIFGNLTLRLVYQSTAPAVAGVPVKIGINYDLHLCLV